MCGISGLIHQSDKPVNLEVLQKINRTLTHRGPDDEGYWTHGPVGIAQRRLSIIDLSGGHQPMVSPDGRYVISFNGEIYNYQQLKKELEATGVQFSTSSDTEVLLQLYIHKGTSCLDQLNGMFAFAIWDNLEKRLFAARDRVGKKPFYYWHTSDLFCFASEPKAIVAHPQFSKKINLKALRYYFQYEYVPEPYCIFEDIYKLKAGHYLILHQGKLTTQPYWDVPLTNEKIDASEDEIADELIRQLDQAVQARLVSDVPLGVFLSGGLDSSSVVALMARHREGQSIKTFSIGFEEKSFDETEHARKVARHFGCDHHEQILTPDKLIEILPEITHFLDEPFADYSIIPTYLLSVFTKKTVTVALGGDGNDELFSGYPTFLAGRMAGVFNALPGFMQKGINAVVQSLPVSHGDISWDFKLKQFLYGAQFEKVLRNQVWLGALHQHQQQKLFVDNDTHFDPLDLVSDQMQQCRSRHWGDQLLYFYQKFYLNGDILTKTDRASMAASLEVRAPYLDVNFINYVSQIPFKFKLKGTKTKYLIKKALEKVLPHEIIYRKKKGFGIPIGAWLTNELKDKMLATLAREKLKKQGLFNPDYVEQMMGEHVSGKVNHRKPLFSLLMFEWWYEEMM